MCLGTEARRLSGAEGIERMAKTPDVVCGAVRAVLVSTRCSSGGFVLDCLNSKFS
ncbi:hypothetical protein ACJIZ3_017115 [Penstemon smallii]|uniref:Uncharacterized protein n=1 Tax=Penstemon smallii TaxID=265156 RepID=A0ABD3SVR3_9LAMI